MDSFVIVRKKRMLADAKNECETRTACRNGVKLRRWSTNLSWVMESVPGADRGPRAGCWMRPGRSVLQGSCLPAVFTRSLPLGVLTSFAHKSAGTLTLLRLLFFSAG